MENKSVTVDFPFGSLTIDEKGVDSFIEVLSDIVLKSLNNSKIAVSVDSPHFLVSEIVSDLKVFKQKHFSNQL